LMKAWFGGICKTKFREVLVHSISNWMTFNENQKRLLTSCFGNGLSLQFLGVVQLWIIYWSDLSWPCACTRYPFSCE
jgi:hypothetical protein